MRYLLAPQHNKDNNGRGTLGPLGILGCSFDPGGCSVYTSVWPVGKTTGQGAGPIRETAEGMVQTHTRD